MWRSLVRLLWACCFVTACAGGNRVTWQPVAPDAAEPQKPEPPVEKSEAPVKPAAERSKSVWIGAAGSSDYFLADLRDQLVGVWIDVPDAARGRVPMALTLTIDTSGSMAGSKIRHARAAARALVASMADGDIVAIQTFSDTAEDLVPPTVLDEVSRGHVERAIGRLVARGATNLHDALVLADRRTVGAPPSHPVRRVVLISDGRATVGPGSAEVLGSLAERGAAHGVQVTAVGVGLDYDEHTLNALAIQSSGRLYHLAESTEMAAILEREMALLTQTVATNASVEIVPAPGVRVVRVEGVRSTASRGAVHVPVGAMFAGQKRELLVRVRVDEGADGQRPLASVRLHFADPFDGNVPRVHEVVVRGRFTHDQTLVASRTNSRSQAIIAMQRAADLASAASRHVTRGDFESADKELEIAWLQLEEGAKTAESELDKKRMVQAASRLKKARKAVRRARSAPKPKSAARASALDLNDAAMEAWGY